jgi:hypothetical protein
MFFKTRSFDSLLDKIKTDLPISSFGSYPKTFVTASIRFHELQQLRLLLMITNYTCFHFL